MSRWLGFLHLGALKVLLAGSLAALLVYGRHPSPPPPPLHPTVTVLCYHKFDSPEKTPFTVPSKNFREQMRYLYVQKIPVIPLPALIAYLHGGPPVPDHSVVVTLDDGYKSAYTTAWPILKQFNFPFTLFIYTHYVGHRGGLSWQQLEEMSRAGVDIESHSLTHPLLTHPHTPMTRAQYLAWMDNELQQPKRELEQHLKKTVTILAYPFGGYDETVVDRTRKAGYLGALTCDDGNVDQVVDPLHINRRLVYRHVKIKEFTQYFPDETLQVIDLSPRDGERLHRAVHEIRGRIANPQQWSPGTAFVLVDKLGRRGTRFTIDPKTGLFRVPLPANPKGGYYFVSLFAHDRSRPGLQREASWLFIISRIASK